MEATFSIANVTNRMSTSNSSHPTDDILGNGSVESSVAYDSVGINDSSSGLVPNGLPKVLKHPPLLVQSVPMMVFLCVAYSLVFILALTNNTMVLTVIYRNPQMRSITNYFLANLAVADITVSFIVLPITLLSNLFTEWYFGWFLCKAIPYLQAVSVGASVSTLAAVAVERYFAIFYPQSRIITPKRAVATVCVLWAIPSLLQVPWALYTVEIVLYNATDTGTYCIPAFPSPSVERAFFLGVVFLTCYLIPLCFMSVFYSLIGLRVWRRNVQGIRGSKAEKNIQRSKIRIVLMLITVAAVFAIAWLPLYCLRMRVYYGPPIPKDHRMILRNIVQPVVQWLGSTTSAVNPFIYCYFSEQFRRYILELIHSFPCFRKRRRNKTGDRKYNGNHNQTCVSEGTALTSVVES